MRTISATAQKITLPADVIKTSAKELAHLKEIKAKDPQGFAKATQGGGQQRTRISNMPFGNLDPNRIASINVIKSISTNSTVINNPIELPDNK